MAGKRIDVLSDTHGRLSNEVLDALDGCDLIVHAGDITSDEDFVTLGALAPLRLCLGNNDWAGEYGPEVTRKVRFEYEGLQFCVCHYRQDLTGERFDVGVFGHTHVPEKGHAWQRRARHESGQPHVPSQLERPHHGPHLRRGRTRAVIGDHQARRRRGSRLGPQLLCRLVGEAPVAGRVEPNEPVPFGPVCARGARAAP